MLLVAATSGAVIFLTSDKKMPKRIGNVKRNLVRRRGLFAGKFAPIVINKPRKVEPASEAYR